MTANFKMGKNTEQSPADRAPVMAVGSDGLLGHSSASLSKLTPEEEKARRVAIWRKAINRPHWLPHEMQGKRVRITHLDGKLPNMALMRLSSYMKHVGAQVTFSKSVERELFEGDYDYVFGSSIFGWSANARQLFIENFPNAFMGGTGTEDATTVEEMLGTAWEDLDYSIYPYFKQSIGFTQRGCRLKCSFCVVPRKEGRIVPSNTIAGIWRGSPHPKQVILLDNDFFGHPDWRARCDELMEGDFEVSLNQGINVRLIHKEGAEVLAKLKYRDDQFKVKRIYTAWDNRKDEEIFLRGIRLLTDAGIKPQNIMVYFLCGYWPGETMDDVLHRLRTMQALKLRPYPMVYNNENKELKKFQCYVIRRYYEIIPWEEYDPAKVGTGPAAKNQMSIFDDDEAA